MDKLTRFPKSPRTRYEELQAEINRLVSMKTIAKMECEAAANYASIIRDNLLQIDMALSHAEFEFEELKRKTRWKA